MVSFVTVYRESQAPRDQSALPVRRAVLAYLAMTESRVCPEREALL